MSDKDEGRGSLTEQGFPTTLVPAPPLQIHQEVSGSFYESLHRQPAAPSECPDDCARGIKTLLARVNLDRHAIFQSASELSVAEVSGAVPWCMCCETAAWMMSGAC